MKPFSRYKLAGFSLVEILVALCLGGVVVSSVYSLFVLQNKSYVNQNNIAEMQQNARMAVNILSAEFRMAGFGFSMNGDYSRPGGTTYAVSPVNSSVGADSVTIQYGIDPSPNTSVTLTNPMANSNSGISMVVSNTAGFEANDYIIISDGQNASRLQVTGINTGASTLQYTSVSPNIFPSGGFGTGSRIYKLRQVAYRISNNVLQSQTNNGDWQDVVNNIEDLQLAYQGTTTPSGTWLDNPSPVNQTTITVVQVNLLARSSAIDVNFTGQRPLLRDHAIGSFDHFRRKLLTTTIRIRNL